MEGTSSKTTDKIENVDDSSVTMVDILNEQEKLEEESNAVLGGSDENNCTYSEGYITRQALYSCLTCIPESKDDPTKRAGVCLACSYKCHENHDLVELYTKRNFRCDCGSVKMLKKKCTLVPFKAETNDLNKYNQNFSGLYCTCHRPYPDPEDEVSDEMMQCIVCEDWYHLRHLDAKVPNAQDFSEMICGGCMSKVDFLKLYVGHVPDLDETLQIEDAEESEPSVENEAKGDASKKHNLDDKTDENLSCSKKMKLDQCTKPTPDKISYEKGAFFCTSGWRKSLCKCSECCEMYKKLNVEFLLNENDTVHWYEENGKLKTRESDYDRGMRALSSLDRVKQVDAITGYNRMKDRLKEFLNTFVVNQQVVTEEDINRFFTTFKNEKNQVAAQPHFCR